jgi:hypothetical protein
VAHDLTGERPAGLDLRGLEPAVLSGYNNDRGDPTVCGGWDLNALAS